jgi:hypothetical protein
MDFINWLRANQDALVILLALAIVAGNYAWRKWQDAKGDPRVFAEALAHDAVETALALGRVGADNIERHDLDNVVGFLYNSAPPIVKLVPLMEVQERAWGIWLALHKKLDAEKRSAVRAVIAKGRAARARVGKA